MKPILTFALLFCGLALSETAKLQWWDGEDEATVWVEPRFTAKIEFLKGSHSNPKVTLVEVKSRNQQRELGKLAMPRALRSQYHVFRNAENGGQKMVATGSVLVRFSPEMDEAAVKGWAAERKVEIVEKVTFQPNAYVLFSEPGLPAIRVANEWRKIRGVIGAEPVWWREVGPR